MAIADETTLRIVLYEGEGAASLNAADRGATVTALLEQGYAVTCAGAGAVVGKIFGEQFIEGYCSEFEARNAAGGAVGAETAVRSH